MNNKTVFFMDSRRDASWVDLPANYHNRACGYAFADGRVEVKNGHIKFL